LKIQTSFKIEEDENRFKWRPSLSHTNNWQKKEWETRTIPAKKIKSSIKHKGIFTDYSDCNVSILPGTFKYITLSVINTGSQQWPENTHLYSTQGITMGSCVKIASLNSQEIGNFQVPVRMPNSQGEYNSVWRLMYYQDGVRKCFGPKMQVVVKSEMDIDSQVGKML
jgi:hypothetical protein